MNVLPQQCRDVAINLLNVSCQPKFTTDKDDDRPFNILTLAWQKRLYSDTGYASSIGDHSDIRIDPHQNTTFQQYSRWTDILKSLIMGKNEMLKSTISAHADFLEADQMRSFVPACTLTVPDVSSEVKEGVITRHFCEFSMSFNHAQIVSVLFGSESQKGVLLPYPQLLELTNNVKFCLQHVQDPVKYLATYATRAVHSAHYRSIDEYLKTWMPLLRMENTTLAAREDSITINDLTVTLNEIDGSFILTKTFCDIRNIVCNAKSMSFLLYENENDKSKGQHEYVPCLDFLCIKCPYIDSNTAHKGTPGGKRIWLAHGQVDKIESRKGEILVHFKLHGTSPRRPALLQKRSTHVCSVEILTKLESDRRTEAALLCLPKAKPVALEAALGQKSNHLDRNYLRLAQQMETEVNVLGLAPNNPKQRQAIFTALCAADLD
ncbi:helicase with zinc finger domain 2-like [Pecten maximus]|uniref:helicase with zinc finger domain 2-like n=1 Tax=Pecten maximus TaxID=6579 RepID=UPI0014584026|nr:helicase with zinc finger domain 2-like [Pecten maximus]